MIHMICVLSTLNRLRCRQIIVSPAQQGPDTRPVTTNSPKTRQSHSLPVPHAPLQRAICACSYLQRVDETGTAHGATLVAGISASVALTLLSPPSSNRGPFAKFRLSRTFLIEFPGLGDRGGGSTGADHGAWPRRTGAAQMAQNKLNKELKNLRTDPMPQGDAAPKGEDMYSWEGFINGAYVLRAAVKAAHSVREGA